MIVLTDVERMEMRALAAEVRAAELTLQITQAARQERIYAIAQAHGLDVSRPIDITTDGRMVQAEPSS